MIDAIKAWCKALWDKAVELRQTRFDNGDDDDWPDDWGLGV